MDKYDFYDTDKVERLQEERTRKYIQLRKRYRKAVESNDEKKVESARKALKGYQEQNEKYKAMADEACAYWYL